MGSNCPVPLKRAVDTKWSARKEAVSCLKKVFSRAVDTLEILTDEKETQETREEAGLLLSAIQTFPFFFFPLYVGAHTVGSGHYAKILTAKKIWTLFTVLQRLEIWMTFCRDKENHWLPTQWPNQQTFVKRWESITTERRIRRRRMMPDEKADDAGLALEQELRGEMLECLDSLSQEIHQVSANVANL